MGQKKKTENAAKTVGFIFVAIVLSKIFGQAREMVIAGLYGTGTAAAAYSAASRLPVSFFDMILGSAVSSAFIPVYNGFAQKDGKERAFRFASSFLNILMVVTVILSVLGVVFAPQIISVFSPNLNADVKSLAIELLRIMFPMIIFVALAYTLVGLLQSMDEFKVPAVMSLVSSVTCIWYLVTLNKKFGIYGLSVALLIGWALQFLIQVYPAHKRGFRYRPTAGFFDSGLKEVLLLALPVLATSWVQPINTTINIMLGSSLDATGGTIAAINYADRLYVIGASVVAISITNYIFPKLSQLHADRKEEEWGSMLFTSLKTVILCVTLIAVLFMVESRELVRVIYERGEFGEQSAKITSTILACYSFGMVGYAVQEVFNKSFFSRQNKKTPMLIAVGTILCNITLCIILSKVAGVFGLSIAVSISSIIFSVVSGFVIAKHTKRGTFAGLFRELIKVFVMAVVTAAACYFAKRVCYHFLAASSLLNSLILLAMPGIVGVVVYIIMAFVMRVDEVTYIKNWIQNR